MTLAAAACTTASAVSAQEPPAITPIAYGETVTNYLASSDLAFQDSSRYKLYVFAGQEGDSITVFLSSPDFNANLILADAVDSVLAIDDDSAGDCNAYVTSVLPVTGQYVIYAAAATAGEIGQFQLSLMRGMQSPGSPAGCRGFLGHIGVLSLGDSVQQTFTSDDPMLSDSSYYHVWLLPTTGGSPFTADVMSDALDAVLMLVRGISDIVKVDDDGGGACNARIVHTPTEQRPYRLVVRTRGKREEGAYTLLVTAGRKPIVQNSPCQRGAGGSSPDHD